ncbi:alpha/beta fold hydrolase [Oceanobacillus sp. J11TS1]|uniref:alpha/beta fold hydrolase n=1 Tax=Oceanobacillus sp. J11TS1 TaxID=2807191 RepID=UPI001B259A37|nr:alpha/beta hydrolase [Oceanobacillus sp. J11TS1]GIO24154.1 hypothetical protein J11TS1_27350 [Oceanobacillus sp. J11TS1]
MSQRIEQLLNAHKLEAEEIVESTSSKLVKEAFTTAWNNLNKGSINASASGETIMFNYEQINSVIKKWIYDLEICLDEESRKFNRIEDPTGEEEWENFILKTKINDFVLPEYESLKQKIEEIDTAFANASLAYRSPLQQALNDINLLYNEINDITGSFTGFENVSVYIHGIEDTGKSFFNTAVKASSHGDIIIHEYRNGDVEYYEVKRVNGENKEMKIDLDELESKDTNNRLHLVYETEYENEHRQKTSDDLAEKFIEMGLLNDETQIDMFAHSYGGRRSFQFAMDYPDNVRSITTIGTPYDENLLGGLANTFPKPAESLKKNSTEYSNYLDFNEENQRVDNQFQHSNAYTDMNSEAMVDDVEELKLANPETHEKLLEMEITAVAGRDHTTYTVKGYGGYDGTYKVYDTSDGAVSVKSQHGESLEAIIDNRFSYDVKGEGISKPAHSFEIISEDFIQLIRQVNTDNKE